MTRSLDRLYLNKYVRIAFVDGTAIEGTVTRFTMYWLQVKLNNGRVVYVNKGSIKMIELVEEEKKENIMGGGPHGNSKPGKQ
jgi:sRNA-binding regulator protein Hfq